MRIREINKNISTVSEVKGTLWRVHHSEATGRYHVIKGYNKDIKMFKNKMGAGDFNSKDAAQAKADELNKGVAEGYKEPTDAAGHAKMAAKIKRMLDDTLADRGDRHGNPDPERLTRAYEYHMQKAKEKSQGVAEGEVVQFPKKHPYELLSNCPKCDGQLQGGKDEKGKLKMCIPCMTLYRAPNQQEMTEGSILKSIKRGLQGWDKDAVGPGGEKLGDPRDIVKRAKAMDTDTAKKVRAGLDGASDHSPAGLQKRVLDRKLKDVAEDLLGELKCWDGYKRVPGTKAGEPGSCEEINESDPDDDLPGAAPGIKIMTPQEFVSGAKKVDEATKLPAPATELKGKDLEDYLDRIRLRDKKKTDKYKLPYIHRSSVVNYYSADGQKYDVDGIKGAIAKRPAKLLKKNEKMKHSDGSSEQFFNVGFAALVGLALDENTNELIVVNTCPGAGSCKIDCFAMKGGKVQFAPAWLSDSRILTYLLNDPDGFFNQLKREISAEVKRGAKKDVKVSIRWHDAGDFFSPEYVDMAFKLAKDLPNVDFYAYTKIADVALGKKPANFMINWSEGASAAQEKKVKGKDTGLEKTKNSRIVPSNLFYDLLVKDEKKNLVKGPEGQWQVIPEKLPELKQRLAAQYKISPSSILSYSEWSDKVRGRDSTPLKYNVIITPGEPDLTAKDPGVLSTLLLKH